MIIKFTKLDRLQFIYDGNGTFDMVQERLGGDVAEAHAEPFHGVGKLRVPLDDEGIKTLGPDGRLIEVSDEIAVLRVFHLDHSLEGTDTHPAERQRAQSHAPLRLRDLWLLNCLNTMCLPSAQRPARLARLLWRSSRSLSGPLARTRRTLEAWRYMPPDAVMEPVDVSGGGVLAC